MSSWFERPKWPVTRNCTAALHVKIGRRELDRSYLWIWLPEELKESEYIQFPFNLRLEWYGLELVGYLSDQYRTYDVLLHCGYRGGAKLTVEQPTDAVLAPYERWEGKRGNLGISAGLLICVRVDQPAPVIAWERTGQLYGDPPSGRAQVQPDGTVVELPPVPLEVR